MNRPSVFSPLKDIPEETDESSSHRTKTVGKSTFQKKSTVLAAITKPISTVAKEKKKAADLIKDPEELQKIQNFFGGMKQKRLIAAQMDGLESAVGTDMEGHSEEEREKEAQELATEFFKKSAKKMFTLKTTISRLLVDKVFDLMLNGNEMALVHAKDFFKKMEELGLEICKDTRAVLIQLFSSGRDGSLFEIQKIESVYRELGIEDQLPESTPFMDYSKLDNESIRLLNKINLHLRQKSIAIDSLCQGDLETIQIEGAPGQPAELVQYIDNKKLCAILRKHKLSDDYELHENLLFFLCIHPDIALEKIMIRKLRVALKRIDENEYCKSLGTELRQNPLE